MVYSTSKSYREVKGVCVFVMRYKGCVYKGV